MQGATVGLKVRAVVPQVSMLMPGKALRMRAAGTICGGGPVLVDSKYIRAKVIINRKHPKLASHQVKPFPYCDPAYSLPV